jgi:hypothetical protein
MKTYKPPARQLSEAETLHIRNVPSRYRSMYIKSRAGSLSPRQAIKAKCLSCVCYEDIQEQVGNCNVTNCPLWAYRPYQKEPK